MFASNSEIVFDNYIRKLSKVQSNKPSQVIIANLSNICPGSLGRTVRWTRVYSRLFTSIIELYKTQMLIRTD